MSTLTFLLSRGPFGRRRGLRDGKENVRLCESAGAFGGEIVSRSGDDGGGIEVHPSVRIGFILGLRDSGAHRGRISEGESGAPASLEDRADRRDSAMAESQSICSNTDIGANNRSSSISS